MRAAGFTLVSLFLTTAVIGNAYYQKKQFYPSVVYITKSNPSMAVIYVQAFILVMLTGKLMRKLFFGQLRAAEFEHLMERSWYAVTETCLAFTVFRDDFSPKFVALFTVLLFLKSFHWLAEDRVDFMERSPVISWLFHLRVLSLLSVLGLLDIHFVGHAYQSTITKGASVQLVFGFEYAILLTIVVNIYIKYILHTIDLQSENPWENKAVYLLYTELVMGFIKVVLYVTFVAIMVRIYTLPLFAFRPMYYTMRAFKKAFNDVILSRRAIRNMNTLYPDATAEELAAADNVCIICREEMVTASKKLPCNHIFHTSCLRSWFQRQQTCPTCRLNILRTPAQASQQGQQQQQQQPAAPQQPGFINPFQPFPAPGAFPGPFPMWPPFQAPRGDQQPPAQDVPRTEQPPSSQPSSQSTGGTSQPSEHDSRSGSGASQPASSGGAAGGSQQQQNPIPPMANMPFFCPPFPMFPFTVPPPPPPLNFSGLTDEELKQMEGQSRESIEARLQCLHDIQVLLDAAVTRMQQYAAAATAFPSGTNVSVNSSRQDSSQTIPSRESTSATSSSVPIKEERNSDSENAEGAVGYTEEKNGSSNVETVYTREQEEIRRRRLQKFVQNSSPEQ